ncbi:MAG: uracil-DNA glycosylase [Rhodobacterales bacterium]
MESELDWHTARALLEWQVDLGVTETISDSPINRYEAAAEMVAAAATAATVALAGPQPMAGADPVAAATMAAAGAADLDALRQAMEHYGHCDLQKGARNLVFSDGHPVARIMLIGEAPGREEDLKGRPFVGKAGQLLDRMLDAIGLARDREDDRAVYITNVVPWRPPQNRDPSQAEIDMMLPFLARHVALVKPDVLVLMGNISCQACLGKRGITRLRGQWTEAFGLPTLPMVHPAYLLRQPIAKREAWADLLNLQAKL